ncbi:hypothetical protein ACOSYY_14480 [Nitrospira sp. BLG_2]
MTVCREIAASPPVNMQLSRMLASRGGESTIAAEVLMDNAG